MEERQFDYILYLDEDYRIDRYLNKIAKYGWTVYLNTIPDYCLVLFPVVSWSSEGREKTVHHSFFLWNSHEENPQYFEAGIILNKKIGEFYQWGHPVYKQLRHLDKQLNWHLRREMMMFYATYIKDEKALKKNRRYSVQLEVFENKFLLMEIVAFI